MNSKPESYIVWFWKESFGHSFSIIKASDALEAAQSFKDSLIKKYGEETNVRILRVNPEKS